MKPDLDAIRARREAATPEPWQHVSVEGGWDGVAEAANPRGVAICRLVLNHPDNATFIAHAPTDIDALLTRVAELEALARNVLTVAPYVSATLSPGNTFPAPDRADWVEVHRGRAVSSGRQLDALEAQARAALKESP